MTPFTAAPTVTDRIAAAEKELRRLESAHNLQQTKTLTSSQPGVRVPSLWATGGVLYWQFTHATTMVGNTLEFSANCIVGDGATSLGHWCDWEFRYYQQIPSIYSDAEKANRTTSAHVVLASGRVNGTGGAGAVEQAVTATIDIQPYHGTYGRFEVWLGGSSDTFGERSSFRMEYIRFS